MHDEPCITVSLPYIPKKHRTVYIYQKSHVKQVMTTSLQVHEACRLAYMHKQGQIFAMYRVQNWKQNRR
jgi:hypothetical protein